MHCGSSLIGSRATTGRAWRGIALFGNGRGLADGVGHPLAELGLDVASAVGDTGGRDHTPKRSEVRRRNG